jgi:DNA-binding response OmpR family regulator
MRSKAHLRILVVEDDRRMLELLRLGLVEQGHEVTTATSAEEGLRHVDHTTFEAIVLDIGLPGRSGFSMAHELRERPQRPAVLMLTALSHEDHVVLGLDAGADDYIIKPFSFPELIARIGSAVRRTQLARAEVLSFHSFRIDTAQRRLYCGHREIHVAHKEFLLLHALAMRRGEAVSRRDLIQAIWGPVAASHGALDTLVNSLREKLSDDAPGLIATIRGSGYCLVEDLEHPIETAQPIKPAQLTETEQPTGTVL